MLKVVPGEAALIFRDSGSSSVLVSDLHLGLEKEMAAKGFRVPPYSVKMIERVKAITESNRADRIIVLGDVKHSIGKVEDIDWNMIPWFFDTLLDLFAVVEVVPGNHDGGIKALLPQRVKLHPSSGTVVGVDEKVGVAHGHSWPLEEVIMSGRIVLGHSHFTYELRDRFGSRTRESVWLSAKYNVERLLQKARYSSASKGFGELMVMPPFNKLVGGQPINVTGGFDFGPVLSSGCVDVASADVFLLDGTRV